MLIILCLSIYLSYYSNSYFEQSFSAEDGIIEWSTTLLLLWSSLFLLKKLIALNGFKSILWKIGTLFLIIIFFFGAGEEISWGQRIFNIQSNTFFLESNSQQETNLHNLMVGKHSVNKIIFGKLIVLGLIFYLLIIPVLANKYYWLSKFINRFAIPIVKIHHTLAFIIATILVLCINSDRKWEVYEFCFALIFALIFYNPRNNAIYSA